MANANTTPIYPGGVSSMTIKNSAANTARDGTGTLSPTFVTAGAQGAVVTRWGAVSAEAPGASNANVLRLWRVNGAVITLIEELALPTATPSTTVIGTRVTGLRTNIILAPTEVLKVTNALAFAVDYEFEIGQY